MTGNRPVYHVAHDAHRRAWLVSEEGSDGAPDAYPTQDEAVEAGKKLAQAHGPAVLRVHAADGGVDYEQEYGADPLVTQLEKFGF